MNQFMFTFTWIMCEHRQMFLCIGIGMPLWHSKKNEFEIDRICITKQLCTQQYRTAKLESRIVQIHEFVQLLAIYVSLNNNVCQWGVAHDGWGKVQNNHIEWKFQLNDTGFGRMMDPWFWWLGVRPWQPQIWKKDTFLLNGC